jgi:hypothetical protein
MERIELKKQVFMDYYKKSVVKNALGTKKKYPISNACILYIFEHVI